MKEGIEKNKLKKEEESFEIGISWGTIKVSNDTMEQKLVQSLVLKKDEKGVYVNELKNVESNASDVGIDEKKLKEAIDKVIEAVDKSKNAFFFECNGKLLKFVANEIYYIESKKRKLIFVGKIKCSPIYMKMDAIEKEVSKNFVRIHQSYLVNMDCLVRFSKKNLTLTNGEVLPVSQSRFENARVKILKYLLDKKIED